MKRLISVFLVIILLSSSVPVFALQAEDYIQGTSLLATNTDASPQGAGMSDTTQVQGTALVGASGFADAGLKQLGFGSGNTLSILTPEETPADITGIRVQITSKPNKYYNIQTKSFNTQAIATGDLVAFSFWAKADTQGQIGPYFQQKGGDGKDFAVLEESVLLNTEWRRYYAVFESDIDFAVNTGSIVINYGYMEQTVYLAALRVEKFTGYTLDEVERWVADSAEWNQFSEPSPAKRTEVSIIPQSGFADAGLKTPGFPNYGAVSSLEAQDAPQGVEGIKVAITNVPTKEFNAQIKSFTTQGIDTGDVVAYSFWVKAADNAVLTAYFQEKGSNAGFAHLTELEAGGTWQRHYAIFEADRDFAQGNASVCFTLGYGIQTVYLGNLRAAKFSGYTLEEVEQIVRDSEEWRDFGHEDKPILPEEGLPEGIELLAPEGLLYSEVQKPGFAGSGGDNFATYQILSEAESYESLPGIRANVHTMPLKYYHIQFKIPTIAPVEKDDIILISFYARTPGTNGSVGNESGSAQIQLGLQENFAPHGLSGSMLAQLGADWVKYYVPCKALADYNAGDLNATFSFGYMLQEVEVAGIRAINYQKQVSLEQLPITRFTYEGREEDAPWRAEALARIEDIRTEEIVVQVLDGDQNPIADAEVHVEMTRSAFNWGASSNQNFLGADRANYEAKFLKYFNTTVFEANHKWVPWSTPADRNKGEQIMEWMLENDISVRGHTLIWERADTWPQDVQDAYSRGDADYVKNAIEAHIKEIVLANKGKVFQWDVVNEPVDNRLFRDMFGEDFHVWAYNYVKSLDPEVELYINENRCEGLLPDKTDRYMRVIDTLLAGGAPLDGIGIQGHFSSYFPPIEQTLEHFDSLAAYGKKLTISEFDIDNSDEDVKADYVRDFLIASYSHPAMEGIVMWKSRDGKPERLESVLFDSYWNLKPCGEEYERLVLGEWTTDESGCTDSNGTFGLRGHLGQYRATITVNGETFVETFTLEKTGTKTLVISTEEEHLQPEKYQVAFEVTPLYAKIIVLDANAMVMEGEGNVFLLPAGRYTYAISAEGYVTQSAAFELPQDQGVIPVALNLFTLPPAPAVDRDDDYDDTTEPVLSANPAASPTIAEVMSLYRTGLQTAKDNVVTMKIPGSFAQIDLATLQTIAKQAAKDGVRINLQIDYKQGIHTQSRLTFDPALATGPINLAPSVSNATALSRSRFLQKWFTNQLFVIATGQTASYGQAVEMAIEADLTGMNTANLVFYSYDKTTNSYIRIAKPDYWVDANGYLHFTTELAADIIVSQGELTKPQAAK